MSNMVYLLATGILSNIPAIIGIVVLILVVLLLVVSCFKIVPQAQCPCCGASWCLPEHLVRRFPFKGSGD